jgi:Flp pilus assembly protein CpaB
MSSSRRLVGLQRRVRRAVLARRRLLAAALTAIAVAAGLRASAEPPAASVPVRVARHDLPAGAVLSDRDLRVADFSPGTPPADLADSPVGRTLAAPLRAGEAVTDVRLVGPALTDGYPGLAAVPVRLPDAGMVDLLRVGDRIDLVSADPQGGGASVVASDVPVLALPAGSPRVTATGLSGSLVVVGAPPDEVADIADASVRTFLTLAFSR